MKKAFIRSVALLLVLAACIPFAACNRGEENEITVSMDDIAEANSTAKIHESFENYLVKWDKPRDGMPSSSIIARDFLYCDDGQTSVIYLRSDLSSYEKSNGTYVCTVRLDEEVQTYLENGYFEYPIIDPDAKSETVLSATADDYHTSLVTRLSAQRSKKVVDTFGDVGEYEYIKAKYILDSESLRIIELAYYRVRSDGAEVELAKARAEYDSKGNRDAENMYAHATDTSYGTRKLTVVLNPDSAEERTITVTARTGDPIALRLGDEYTAAYSNRECTIPYKSNEKYDTDETVYCTTVTELADNVKISDIISSSTTDNILKRFDNYLVHELDASGKVMRNVFITGGYSYIDGGECPEIYLSDGRTFEYDKDRYVATIKRPAEVSAFKKQNFDSPLLVSGMENDEIIETETGSHYFLITVRPTKDRYAELLERFEDGEGYIDIQIKYTVNRATLFLEHITYYGVLPSGVEKAIYAIVATYNSEGIKLAKDMYEYVSDTTQKTRTVTVMLDPDTENETVLSATTRSGEPVALRLGDEYKTVYTNRECTNIYRNDGNYDTNEILYCKRQAT